MKLKHHNLVIELPDEWWLEAGMATFVPRGRTFRTYSSAVSVRIDEIAPVSRAPGVAIFNDDRDTGRSARDRVISIFRGFREDATFPPVKVVQDDRYGFRLTEGCHRLYCSLAVGFTHVPTVEGCDPEADLSDGA